MDKLTQVEEQLKAELDRLNEIVYLLRKENKGLKKKNGKQKHIMTRMSEKIRKLQTKQDKQHYYNVQKGAKKHNKINNAQ